MKTPPSQKKAFGLTSQIRNQICPICGSMGDLSVGFYQQFPDNNQPKKSELPLLIRGNYCNVCGSVTPPPDITTMQLPTTLPDNKTIFIRPSSKNGNHPIPSNAIEKVIREMNGKEKG